MRNRLLITTIALLTIPAAVSAHKLIKPGANSDIAKGAFATSPTIEWNRLSTKEGKYQEIWTLDGDSLNKVTFFGGVPEGQPLFKEQDKKHAPLPKVTTGMLITDIPALLENTYRAQRRTNNMSIGEQKPSMIDGRSGIRFQYTFISADDEVERKGEAYAAVIDGRLFLVTYEAPGLYFFDKDLAEFRTIASSLKIGE